MLFKEKKIKLRDYQSEAIKSIYSHFNDYKYPQIAVLPTGAGKSVIICEILKLLPKYSKILVLQPNKEILVQNFNKYQNYSNDCSIYSASLNKKIMSKVVFATIGSIYKISHKFCDYRYLIIDECHLVNAKDESAMYTDFICIEYINKITTTNSTGLLEPQKTDRLEVLDCEEIFKSLN
jgi:DNA repair protein RadD